MYNRLLFYFFITSSFLGFSQEFNTYDADGKRHGKWQKKYDNSDQLRYEGTFDHGKEIGEFKFYKPKSGDNPTAIKKFSKVSDSVKVTYFTNKKKVISEGAMIGKDRVGIWKYYHQNSSKIMMSEVYELGKLNGEQLTYFENGQLTEKTVYVQGKKEGKRLVYSEEGVIMKELMYENDQLHGVSKYYDMNGNLKKEGAYKRDRKDGTWSYYEKGKLSEQKIFPLQRKGS